VGYRQRGSARIVLEGLNLSIRPEEVVCLLGPNGAGKSTLLRTAARIQPALSGKVEVEGVDASSLSVLELARRVAVVLTERPALGGMTAHRVVELGRYPHVNWSGRLSEKDHAAVSKAIRAVGAEPLASRDTSTLSDGERQRFMIARALAQEPSVLLLDEPTAFLDVPSRVELMGLLRRLAREEHLAIVVSTHDLDLALRMADTLWLVAPGGQLHVGTPEDIILKGTIEETFRAESIRFKPEERSFRLVTGGRGCAVIHGEGLHAVLAAAVLEREGFEVVLDDPNALNVTVSPEGARWEVAGQRGEGFASLAQCVRVLGQDKGLPSSAEEGWPRR